MKNFLILGVCIFCFSMSSVGQVGVGTATPHASAALEVTATDKGLLPPRLTTAQQIAINSPAEGLTIYNTDTKCIEFWNGSNWISTCNGSIAGACAGEPAEITFNGLIYKPVASFGKCWLDRNLGASTVTSSPRSSYVNNAAYITAEQNSFGSFFQWGRFSDGHENRSSGTTSVLSNTDSPIHGDFIVASANPFDWRSPQNNNLWQGVAGINNPCPTGYRIPTAAEWIAERNSWNNNNREGAFTTPLKLPVAGYRDNSSAAVVSVGVTGEYWSSTVSTIFSTSLSFDASNAPTYNSARAYGLSVRCIKN